MNTNIDREKVKNKYNGLCAFCGGSLKTGCHIWDIKPIQLVVNQIGELERINTDIENLMPACKACNGYRTNQNNGFRKMDIETFREEIMKGFEFLKGENMVSSYYKRAIKFGQIIETSQPVTFYFEKLQRINP